MLRIENPHKGQMNLFDSWIPKEFIQLTEELAIVDKLLDDETTYEPIKKKCKSLYERLFGHPPDKIAGDCGCYSEENEKLLMERGVKRISIPKPGKKSKERKDYEAQYWFRRLQRFRAGSEAKISLLKRKFGLGRSLVRGDENVVAWIGWGVFAHNLWKIAALM